MNSHFENDKKSLTLEILKEGEIISAYQKKRNELAMRNSFESFIDYKGSIYKVLCCNASGNSKLFGDLINEYDADAELAVPICKCMVNEIVENMSQSEIYELRNGDKAVMKKYRDLREKSSVKCREPFNNLLQKGKK